MTSVPLSGKITIVLPTYNRAQLLPRALESVLLQSFAEWELVVVDDGSVDTTPSVIREYCERDSRIRGVRQRNLGLSGARNTGIRNSRSDFLTFLDSDDEYLPSHLELRYNYLMTRPEVHMLHGGVQVVGGPDSVPDCNDPSRTIPLTDCFIGGTFFMRRMVPRELGGFRKPDYGDDYEFMLRAIRQFRVERVDFPTYVYHRETPDSLCNLMAEQSTLLCG